MSLEDLYYSYNAGGKNIIEKSIKIFSESSLFGVQGYMEIGPVLKNYSRHPLVFHLYVTEKERREFYLYYLNIAFYLEKKEGNTSKVSVNYKITGGAYKKYYALSRNCTTLVADALIASLNASKITKLREMMGKKLSDIVYPDQLCNFLELYIKKYGGNKKQW